MVQLPFENEGDEEFKWIVSVDNGTGKTKYWRGPLWKNTERDAWSIDIDSAASFVTHNAARQAWTECFPDVPQELPNIHTLRASRRRAESGIILPHTDVAPVMSRPRTGLVAPPTSPSPFPAAQSARERRRENRNTTHHHKTPAQAAANDDDDWAEYYGVHSEYDHQGGFTGLVARASSWMGRPKFSKERVREIFVECFDGINPQPSANPLVVEEPDGSA